MGERRGNLASRYKAEDVRAGSWVVKKSKEEERSGMDEEKEECRYRWIVLTESA